MNTLQEAENKIDIPKQVILVEDNPGDVYLVRSSLAICNLNHNFHHIRDGEEVMDCLHQKLDYSNFPQPDLILLDLNLPKKSGFEVLSEIKTDPMLKIIPVVILTSSSAEQDINLSYKLHANSYFVKPTDFSAFIEVIRQIEVYWLNLSKLPSQQC